MHVIWVPTVIMLFSYDVFKYKSSSKTKKKLFKDTQTKKNVERVGEQ